MASFQSRSTYTYAPSLDKNGIESDEIVKAKRKNWNSIFSTIFTLKVIEDVVEIMEKIGNTNKSFVLTLPITWGVCACASVRARESRSIWNRKLSKNGTHTNRIKLNSIRGTLICTHERSLYALLARIKRHTVANGWNKNPKSTVNENENNSTCVNVRDESSSSSSRLCKSLNENDVLDSVCCACMALNMCTKWFHIHAFAHNVHNMWVCVCAR